MFFKTQYNYVCHTFAEHHQFSNPRSTDLRSAIPANPYTVLPMCQTLCKALHVYRFISSFNSPTRQVSQSAWVAITKHHGLGGLNNNHLFSYSSRDWKFKTKVQQSWCLVRALLIGVDSYLLTVCSPGLSSVFLRVSELSGVSSYEDTNLWDQGSIFNTSFNLNYFLRATISKYSYTGGQGFNICILGDTNIQSTMVGNIGLPIFQVRKLRPDWLSNFPNVTQIISGNTGT